MLKIIISKNWAEKPFPTRMSKKSFYTGSIHFRQFQATLVFVAEKPPPWMREIYFTLDLSISGNFEQLWFLWQKSPPQDEGNCFTLDLSIFRQFWATLVFVDEMSPPFLPFCDRPDSCHTCGIPMVSILQICTQIPSIQISSLGYQLCQLFQILTYTEVQDTGLWCSWQVYRQPYHNTH